MARILVTGATGKVGSQLVPLLVARGDQVLGLTGRPEAQDALMDLGATPVVADLRNPASLANALDSLDALFLVTADDPRQDMIETALIETIGQYGQPHVVKLSAQSAGLDPPVSFGVFHRRSEQALEHGGLPFTILRPTFFQQSLLLFASDVANKNRIIAPTGQGRIAMVNTADVARTAVAVLCNQQHFGKTYVLTGPDAHSFPDVTDQLSRLLGRPIGFVSPPAFIARLALPFMTGMPRWQSNLVVDLMSALRAGAQERISGDVQAVTGQPPSSLDSFLSDHADAFRN